MRRFMKIVAILLIVGVIVGIVVYRHSQETVYNEGYVNGNSDGNLYNSGLFCEYDGTVYFSNPNDSFHLYSMDVSGGNLKQLADDAVKYINADEKYLYYTRNNSGSDSQFGFLNVNRYSLCRRDKTGKNELVLDQDPCIYASLFGNTVYYLHYDDETATQMYKVSIDGQEQERVSEEPIYTCGASGQYLYYAGQNTDHNIHVLDTSTDSDSVFLEGSYWMPVYSDGYLYYLDLEAGYTLCKLNMETMEETTIVNKRIDTYNVYGNMVYYQLNSTSGDAGVYCCQTDGSNEQLIKNGEFCDINITSAYVYFREYQVQDVYYCTPTNSTIDVETFMPEAQTE